MPHKLHIALLLYKGQIAQYALVEGACTERTANHQYGAFARHQTEAAHGIVLLHRALEQVLAHGISRKEYFVGREETRHAVVSHTYLACLFGKQFVGHAGIRVLLLQQSGYAHAFGHIECGSAGIAAHAYCHLRTEVAQDAARHAAAFQYFEQHGYVLQQIFAIKAGYGQSLDGVACCWHTLHFHTSLSAYKKYLGIGAFGLYFVGDGHGRKDVASSTSTADDDSQFVVHRSSLYSTAQI